MKSEHKEAVKEHTAGIAADISCLSTAPRGSARLHNPHCCGTGQDERISPAEVSISSAWLTGGVGAVLVFAAAEELYHKG